MSSQLEPVIWSPDTSQRISCFDRCQLTTTWMSNIKHSSLLSFCLSLCLQTCNSATFHVWLTWRAGQTDRRTYGWSMTSNFLASMGYQYFLSYSALRARARRALLLFPDLPFGSSRNLLLPKFKSLRAEKQQQKCKQKLAPFSRGYYLNKGRRVLLFSVLALPQSEGQWWRANTWNISFPNLVINTIRTMLNTRPTSSDINMTVTNLTAWNDYFSQCTGLPLNIVST